MVSEDELVMITKYTGQDGPRTKISLFRDKREMIKKGSKINHNSVKEYSSNIYKHNSGSGYSTCQYPDISSETKTYTSPNTRVSGGSKQRE